MGHKFLENPYSSLSFALLRCSVDKNMMAADNSQMVSTWARFSIITNRCISARRCIGSSSTNKTMPATAAATRRARSGERLPLGLCSSASFRRRRSSNCHTSSGRRKYLQIPISEREGKEGRKKERKKKEKERATS